MMYVTMHRNLSNQPAKVVRMAMKRTNIYLDEAQARLLRHLAVEQDTSFTAVVRQAINEYLERNNLDVTALVRGPDYSISDEAWHAGMDAALQRIRAGVPADMTSQEIEDLITAASNEVREERRARERVSNKHG
jgi:predicted transcriptional regulator